MAKGWEYKAKKAIKSNAQGEFEYYTKEELIDYILLLRTTNDTRENKIVKFDKEATKPDKELLLAEKNYQQKWSLASKVTFLLKINYKPLTSEALHRQLMRLDTHYKDYDNPKSNLSVCMDRVTKSKRVAKIKLPGIRVLYFALPEWMDAYGKINEEFKVWFNPF